jgi:hydroxyacyl-ACP dehydratase HTD2-like protein with hotdog domain/photosystem II stability/assembly factor-like uncharacterized protein
MSWKKYGGTNKLDKFNNLSVSTIVTDQFTLRNIYVGDWDICGGLRTRDDGNFGRDVNVVGTITCGNINILGTLGVLDTRIVGDLIIDNNVFVGQDIYMSSDTSAGTLFHGDNEMFGFNTYDPEATVDISSGLTKSLYIQSSAPTNKNVIAQNATHDAITVNVEPTTAYIDFYVDGSLNDSNTPDGRLVYEQGGNFTIDVSNVMKVRPRTIFSQDLNRNFLGDERLIVYTEPSDTTTYLPEVYNQQDFRTGTGAYFVTGDNSSNVFVRLATEQGSGLSVGGGYFLNNRIMGTLALTDASSTIYPALTVISGNLTTNLKTSIAINKSTVSTTADGTNRYAMDINGPIKLVHEESIGVLDASFEILRTEFFGNAGFAVGGPSSSTAPHTQFFGRTTDGGYTWSTLRLVNLSGNPNPNSLENTPHGFTSIFMQSANNIYIAGDSGYFFNSTNGGQTWATVTYNNPTNLPIQANALHITTPSNRLIIGVDNATGIGNGRILNSTTFTDISTASFISTGLARVKAIHGTNGDVVIAGQGGLTMYSTTTNTFGPIIATDASFNAVKVYDGSHAVAVGYNVIYFTHDMAWPTATWSQVSSLTGNLQSVQILDPLRAIAVGDAGLIVYSTDGFANWTRIDSPSDLDLTNINILNANDFVITGTAPSGKSEVINLYAPYLLNRPNNHVIEASGNIVVSGDLQVNDAGQILSNNETFNVFPTTVKEVNIGNTIVGGNTNVKANLDVTLDVTGNQRLFIVGDSSLNGNLMVLKDTSLNQKLFVRGDASFNSNITVIKDASLNQRLFVGGDASFNSNITVIKDASLNQRLFVQGDASFNSNITVIKDTSLNQRLFVQGDASFNSNITVIKDTSLNQRLFVQGDASFNSNITVIKDTSLNQRLFVGGDASFNSNITVIKDTSLNQRLFVGGDASFNSNITVMKDTSLNQRLFVQGDASFNSNITVIKDTSLNQRLFVQGDASFNSNITVIKDSSLNQRLFVGGDASFNSNITVLKDASLNQRLFVQGDASFNSNITVLKDASLNQRLFVGGDASFNSNITVLIDTSLNRRLFVGGDASFNSNLRVLMDTSLNQRLFVGGDASFNSNLTVLRDSSLNQRLFVGGDASFNSNLTVLRDSSLNQRLFVGGDASFNSNLRVLMDTSLNQRLFVGGDASFNSNLTVINDTSLNKRLFLQGDASFNSNITVLKDSSMNQRLFVGGDASFNSNITVLKDSSMNQRLFVGGDASFNSNLRVLNDTSLNRRLFVGGDASFNSNLRVQMDTSLNQRLFVGGDASFNSNITVLKDTSLNQRLFVGGDASFNSNITVLKDTSLNQRLFVGGDASFNSNLRVLMDTSLNQRLFVGGDASFNSNLRVLNDTSLNKRLFVGGDASFNSNLTVINDTSLNKRLFLQGDASFNSNITVINDTSLNKRLFVGGDASFNSNLTVINDTSLNKRLFVGGDASFNSNLRVLNDTSLNQRLFVGGDASFNSNLRVLNDISLNRRLFVGGDASFNSNLRVLLDTSLCRRLFVGGDASFNSNLTVLNDTSLNKRLFVGGSTKVIDLSAQTVDLSTMLRTNTIDSLQGSTTLTIGGTNAGNVTIKTTSGTNNYLYLGDTNSNVQINGNLFLPGSITTVNTSINNLEIKNKTILLNDEAAGFNVSAFSGLMFRDNNLNNQGQFLMNGKTDGFLFKSSFSPNRVNLDVSGLTLTNGLTQGFVLLKANEVVDVSADYTITTGTVAIQDIQQLDTSLNRRVERNPTTTTATTQVVDTKILATGLYVNKAVDDYIANSQMDIAGNVFMSKLGLATSSVNSSYTLDVAGSAKVTNNIDMSGSLSVQTNINSYGTILQW